MKARTWAVVWVLAMLVWPLHSQVGEPSPESGSDSLSSRHQVFLSEAEFLLTEGERSVFLELEKDYQRDTFIARFWRSRDPFPQTGRNEFRERWQERLVLAKDLFGDLSGDRARMLLYNGEPEQKEQMFCSELLRPMEVWQYSGTEVIRSPFALVFYSRGGSRGPYRLWYPSQGLSPLLQSTASLLRDGTEAGNQEARLGRMIGENCVRSEQILAGLSGAADWGQVEEAVAVVPSPGDEWLQTFQAYSTDLPDGVERFDADLAVTFPGREQSRTVVQGLVTVPLTGLPPSEEEVRGFVLDGEILRQGELFEHFRYRFPLRQAEAVEERLPLVFQRNLRPGSYKLIVKVEDLASGQHCRRELELEVPSVQTLATARTSVADAGRETARRLGEANSALTDQDYSIEIFAPSKQMMVGKARFAAEARGEGISKVRFELDGKPVLAKKRPPYSVELDLGRAPRLHTLRAVALGSEGEVLAADEVAINAGPHRFAVRLLEPRPGAQYVESLRAHAAVEVPRGERLDRLELYLNDTLVGTLYQPPFVQPLLLPASAGSVDYVRAVAYLADGNFSEHTVIVNSPHAGAEVDVRLVELFTSAVDRKGRPVEGLTAEDFTVLDEGVEQEIRRFEKVEDLPIYAGLLLDTSQSMSERIEDSVDAALAFFDTVLRPKDRAAVITFNEEPSLVVRFTNDRDVLAGGVAGLTAEGETALYDSVIYALYYFSEIRGKRTLILISDGEDVESEYRYQDVVDYARRTGVTIYSVGLSLNSRQTDVRLKLSRLASETGGQAFFIDDSTEMERVYRQIEDEVRTQYLLSYQANTEVPSKDKEGFRRVEVKVKKPGVEAKTIKGYYP